MWRGSLAAFQFRFINWNILAVLHETYNHLAFLAKLLPQQIKFTIVQHFTVIDNHHPLAELLHIGEIMGGKPDHGLTLLVDVLDKAPDAPLMHFDLPLVGFAGNKNRK